MDRRELFGALGGLGAGLALNAPAVQAADHGKTDGSLNGPVVGPFAHFCGIHIAKHNPKLQFITQHYCAGHSPDGHGDDLFQCLLYDGCGKNAKLVGVEYIITDKQYRTLPEAEKKYWHPHTYEVLAGGLIAPSMTPADEDKFMKMVLTTWGKTWHTWPDPRTPVPMGEPLLIWSLTGDGQADDQIVAARDMEFKVSTAQIREKRGKDYGLEVPQIPQPKSVDQVGRQWTSEGEDKPKARK